MHYDPQLLLNIHYQIERWKAQQIQVLREEASVIEVVAAAEVAVVAETAQEVAPEVEETIRTGLP